MSKTSIPSKFFEKDRLALHHWLRGERADIAEAKHRGAVAHDRDEVLADRQFRYACRIGDDCETGRGDAR